MYSLDEEDILRPVRASLCFDTVVPMGGEERRRANVISGIIILISGVVHSFYYVSVLRLLGTKAILKNPDNPQLYTSPWKGRLREVTRGKVQRAVPKSAHG